jgi:hypothetical protein
MTVFSMELTFAAQEVTKMTQLVQLRRDQIVQEFGGMVSSLVALGSGMDVRLRGGDSLWEVQPEDIMDFEGNNNTN